MYALALEALRRDRLEHLLRNVEVRVDVLDVVVLLERVREREVRGRIGPALPRGDDDRARELREELAALGVRGALLVLDRGPLAMPRHAFPPPPAPGSARARACRRSAPGGTRRRGSGPAGAAPARLRARRGPRPPIPPRARAARG